MTYAKPLFSSTSCASPAASLTERSPVAAATSRPARAAAEGGSLLPFRASLAASRGARALLALALLTIPPAASLAAETDWVLVLDRSESMTQNDPYNCRFDAQKIMVDLLAQGVEEKHRLTIIRFAGVPEAVLKRSEISPESLEKIRKLISDDPPMGDTDIGAALTLAREIVKPEGRASDVHVFLLSDGVQAGKTPNLAGRLEDEKKVLQEIGLSVNTILLNDMSIPKAEREERRKRKLYYEDKQLQAGEDLMRDIARKTGGQAAQVLPDRGIEDLLIELIAPHMSFHREAVSARLTTWPTDRQLFCVLNRSTRDLKLRIGPREIDINLDRAQQVGGDFELTITPYRNRTVVVVRPAENVRWPEWMEFLPGRSGTAASGDVFVISNVRLEAQPGLSDEVVAAEGVKTRIRENEVYPVRFRISTPGDLTPERQRSIQDSLKKSGVHIDLTDAEGKTIDQTVLAASEVHAGTGNRLYFLPTSSPKGEAKVQETFTVRVRSWLEQAGAASTGQGGKRPLCRAPDRIFTITPSAFDWFVRKNWKGEPLSSSRPATRREVDLELGQELRLEVAHSGQDALGGVEMTASFGAAGEAAARKLNMKDEGGVPHTFVSEWIFPVSPGVNEAKVTVKAGGVQEATFKVRVLQDDFRLPNSQYNRDGSDSPQGRDLGAFLVGEKVQISRTRTINRLSPELTARYWEAEQSSQAKAFLLRKDPASGSWAMSRQVALTSDPPTLGSAEIVVTYRGEVADLEPGEYSVAWPEKKPLGADPIADRRLDHFSIQPRAFTGGFAAQDGKALEVDAGKPTMVAGSTLLFRLNPSKSFPEAARSSIVGTLTWARKDVGAPQEVKAVKAQDGAYSLSFPTTDFHTGPAKLHVVMKWTDAGRERVIEEDHEVFSRTKALGIAIEPVEEDVLIGQKGSAIRFRLRAIGGQNAQAQRDLLSVWQSQPANVTIGDSEKIHHVDLAAQGDALLGALETEGLPPGTYKLVVSSPLAKLGQDVAACFFNVKPCPYAVTVTRTTLGAEPRVILGPGAEQATCDGDGALLVSVEPTGQAGQPKPVSAELRLNGRKVELRWSDAEGKLRSEPLSLESLEKKNTFALALSDDANREFLLALGVLDVVPVPLKYEVTWTRPPPADLGRGEQIRIEGALIVRGGLKSQREEAGKALNARPFLDAVPAGVLGSFELLPPPRDDNQLESVFGVKLHFAATLIAAAGAEFKDSLALSVRSHDGETVESRKVAIGPSTLQLVFTRADGTGEEPGSPLVPFMARERIKIRIEGQSPQRTSRIQVLPSEDQAGAPVAAADGAELVWLPKKDGSYTVRAEAALGPGSAWKVEEKITIQPLLKLEWARDLGGTIKLDDGQKLPLAVKLQGPESLDKESFDRLFQVKPEVLTEGLEQLNVEFTDWEAEKGSEPGSLVLSTFSTKPLSTSAAKVRVKLLDKAGGAQAPELDALDLDLVRGGGSLVEVTNFEKGQQGIETKDLPAAFQIARDSTIRLGYRPGGLVESADTLRKNVAAIVVSEDGQEKVLDVETSNAGLVVFAPFAPSRYGQHTLRLEIRGKTPLLRNFQFEVTKGTGERAVTWVLYAVGLGLLGLLGFLGARGVVYNRDRQKVLERVHARRDKALSELNAEPRESLGGSLRMTIGTRTIGPLELGGNISGKEVDAWVTEHFSVETSIFSDAEKNQKRLGLIQRCLAEARTELCLETEKRLPIRGADICLIEKKDAEKGTPKTDLAVIHDSPGRKGEGGDKALLSLRLQPDGKLRVTTASGRSVTLSPGEDFPYNGWIGKSGKQVRASIKVPGVADYGTVVLDLN